MKQRIKHRYSNFMWWKQVIITLKRIYDSAFTVGIFRICKKGYKIYWSNFYVFIIISFKRIRYLSD